MNWLRRLLAPWRLANRVAANERAIDALMDIGQELEADLRTDIAGFEKRLAALEKRRATKPEQRQLRKLRKEVDRWRRQTLGVKGNLEGRLRKLEEAAR